MFKMNFSQENILDVKECCVICGNDHNIDNCDFVKITEHVYDNKIPSRAKLSLPEFLQLQILTDGSYSVVTKKIIQKGTKFGPFLGEKTQTLDPSIIFPLKIETIDENNVKSEYYLDISDENKCSWLIFVSPAENTDEQNLVCYQENKQIYYVAIKTIAIGDNLKVWYSPFYAQKMNKTVLKHPEFDPLKNIDVNTLIKKQQKIMERKLWTCKFCGQMENNIISFAKHMLKHYSSQLKRICEICKKPFSSKRGLAKHLKIVHKSNYQSPTKQNPVTQSSLLNNKPHLSELALGGPLLNDIFTDSSELNQFDLNNIDNQNLLLDSDNLIVESFLNENVKDLDHFNFEIDETPKQFVCDICLKQFNKLKLLVIHLRHHTGEFICVKCLKIFCRRENLNSHLCNSNMVFTCNICKRKFSQKKYLSRHMVSIHRKKFKCQKCIKYYYSKRELDEHNCSGLPTESKEKFSCSICSKVFLRNTYLKKHMKTHYEVNKKSSSRGSLVCEICGLTLQNKNSHYLHVKKHNEPTHSCEICDKKFYRVDTLRNHLQTHDPPPEDIECEMCKKKFKTTKIFKAHLRKHRKPDVQYKCQLCPSVYSQNRLLYRHTQRMHSQNSNKKKCEISEYYSCPLCEKTVKLRSSLLRHMRKLHENKMADVDFKEIKPIPITMANNQFKPKKKTAVKRTKKVSNVKLLNPDLKLITNVVDIEINKLLKNDNKVPKNVKIIEKETDSELISKSKEESEVCLSIPDLTEGDQEITLDRNAYILDNGTIVQPQANSDNVIIYVLDQAYT